MVGSSPPSRADAVLGTWWLRCGVLSGDVLLISSDAKGVSAGVCVTGGQWWQQQGQLWLHPSCRSPAGQYSNTPSTPSLALPLLGGDKGWVLPPGGDSSRTLSPARP